VPLHARSWRTRASGERAASPLTPSLTPSARAQAAYQPSEVTEAKLAARAQVLSRARKQRAGGGGVRATVGTVELLCRLKVRIASLPSC